MNNINFYTEEFTIFASMALIGDIINMSSNNLENLRERAQYMHFFRSNYKKISELLNNWNPKVPKEGINSFYPIISDIYYTYGRVPKATKKTCPIISKELLITLSKYGFKPSRNITIE